MNLFRIIALAAFLPLLAHGASFPYVTLNGKTNRLSDSGSALTYNGTSIGGVTFANPTASVSGSAVNGSASTAMRSDAAPALASGAALANIGSQSANLVLASPNGSSGNMSPRALASADLPSPLVIPEIDGGTLIVTNSITAPSVTVTNAAIGTVPVTINNASGATNDNIYVSVGGTTTFRLTAAGALRALAGSSANPSFSFLASTNTGIYGNGANIVYVCGGTDKLIIGGNDIKFPPTSEFAFCSDAAMGLPDTYIHRETAQWFGLGLDISTAPLDYILTSGSSFGSNGKGAKLTLGGGRSTGTGISGPVDISTGLTGETSGSTGNSLSIRAHYKPGHVALTHTTATTIETFSLAANNVLGGRMTVTCYATNSTPHLQSKTSVVTFDAVAVSTAITGTVTQSDNTTAADSGTLTCTYSLLDNGNNTFSIQANANSSLSSPTERAKIVATALNGTGVTTVTDP